MSAGTEVRAPLCPKHKVAMRESRTGDGWFCSQKDPDGPKGYCTQKAPADPGQEAAAQSTALATRPAVPEWINQQLGAFVSDPSVTLVLPSIPLNLTPHPWFRMSVSMVNLSPRPEDGDCHKIGGFLVLSRVGLDKLANAAGISFPSLRRTDDHKDPDYCEVEAVGTMKNAAGDLVEMRDLGSFYMPDVSAEAWRNRVKANDGLDPQKRLSETDLRFKHDAEMSSFRRKLLQRTTTNAKERVTKALLAMRGNFTAEALAKPMIVARWDFAGDMNDPQVKQHMLDQATGARRALYGPERPARTSEAEIVEEEGPDEDADLEPIGDGHSMPALPSSPAQPSGALPQATLALGDKSPEQYLEMAYEGMKILQLSATEIAKFVTKYAGDFRGLWSEINSMVAARDK